LLSKTPGYLTASHQEQVRINYTGKLGIRNFYYDYIGINKNQEDIKKDLKK